MLTLFSNTSFLQHYDVICILDRLQAMGNHDQRFTHCQGRDCFLHNCLILWIDICSRLVQNDHRGVLQHGAGNGNPLPLTAGKMGTGAADNRIIAIVQPADKGVATTLFGGLFHLRVCGAGSSHADILEKMQKDFSDEKNIGDNLVTSLDVNLQQYAQQAALQVMEKKSANQVSVIIMNPQNGEILAMVNVPEFNLNEPFTLNTEENGESMTDEKKQDALNQMWRNGCINDTYEPGSTFKIITASACLEEGVVHLDDTFSCPGYRVVEDRKIRCHKVGGHGSETFVQGIQNSCNPVFIDIGLRLGVDRFYDYFGQFGLMDMTGVDLPGEAGTIMHKKENIGLVELATMSFGQSFQITPMQMATTVSSLINGGRRVTPHFGVRVLDSKGKEVEEFRYKEKKNIVSEETSATMRMLLESVVSEGSGKNAKVEGFRIGGKTATSQTLPRSANKYISSFIGFAPADNPQVLGMCVIYNPQGVYYGGTIAAPVIGNIFENILPYLGIEKQ